MSDKHTDEPAPSVFGNLPASRPGTRSPRRTIAPSASAAHPPEPDPPAESASAEADPPPCRAQDEAHEAHEPDPGEGSGGLEDLAWAGVATAAEAATLGVRLATRAVEALRDAASRR